MAETTPNTTIIESKTTSSTHSLATSAEQSGKPLVTLDIIGLQHLVRLIESIFQNVAAASESTHQSAHSNDITSSLVNFGGMPQALNDIRCISCEMSCNLSTGKGSEDQTKNEMLRRLEKYSWNAQVVLAMAAFASSIGEWSMLVKNKDLIANSVNILKGNSPTLDLSVLKDQGLFTAMIEVVKTNLAFLERHIPGIPKKAPPMKDATNNILGIVSRILTILSKREDIIVAEPIRLLAQEINDINTNLQKTLDLCEPDAIEKTAPYQYDDHRVKPIPTISTSEVIQKIKNYIQEPEKLTNKHVLFLISDLDISIKEIKALNRLYEKNGRRYEILWLPIVDLSANEANESRFLDLKQSMKWSVVEPSKIEAKVIEYIKKDWQFLKQPIAVSVNTSGDVTCRNALPMLWTWGNSAFPFTDEKEQKLWNKIDEQDGWRLELLLDGLELRLDDKRIDTDIRSWRESGTIVCLFGGGDISWIQEFKEKVKYAAHAAGVSLKLVYLGQNKGKILTKNVLGRDIHFMEPEFQWQFWSRLESILYAKIRRGETVRSYAKTDQVMQEASKAVGYGGRGEAWATFSMGPGSMETISGEMALNIMANYGNWPQDKTGIRFLEGLKTYKRLISRQVHGCINVHLPVLGQIPGAMSCPECSKVMEMFYTYRCCPKLLANTLSPSMF